MSELHRLQKTAEIAAVFVMVFSFIFPVNAANPSNVRICDPSDSTYSNQFFLYANSPVTKLTLPPSACGGFFDTAYVFGNRVNFTNIAFGSASNPARTFGFEFPKQNLTVTLVQTLQINFTIKATLTTTTNTTFYYVQEPTSVLFVNNGISTTVAQAQFWTVQSQYSSCTTPCVYVNPVKNILEMKVTQNSPNVLVVLSGVTSGSVVQSLFPFTALIIVLFAVASSMYLLWNKKKRKR